MIITASDGTYIQQLLSSNNPLLVVKGNNYILIDTGRKKNWKIISERLDRVLKASSLLTLIITHAHYDHVENAACIKSKYETKMIVHRSEREYIQKGVSSPLPSWAYAMGSRINDMYKYYYEPTIPDILVDEQLDLTEYGFNAYIIHTPGHSPGSMSVIINNELAITSDALGGMKKKSINKKIRKASVETICSWETLIDIKCKKYITAHNGMKEYDTILNEYHQYLMESKK